MAYSALIGKQNREPARKKSIASTNPKMQEIRADDIWRNARLHHETLIIKERKQNDAKALEMLQRKLSACT
jgi:hypothetical protein